MTGAEYEESAVGAIILSPDHYEQTGLMPEHFFDPRLQVVWKAVGELRQSNEPVDELTIADKLGGRLDACGGFPFLSSLAAKVPTADNVQFYADKIRESYLVRRVKLAASEVVQAASEGTSGDALLDLLTEATSAIVKESDRVTPTMKDAIQEQLRLAAEGKIEPGLPSGIGIERICPGGISRDKVTILFADTGTFKTTIKNWVIKSMAQGGHRVLDVSLEDAVELTAHRYIAQDTGIAYGRISGGQLTEAEMAKMSSLEAPGWAENIISGDSVAPRMKDIIRKAQQLKASGGLSAVVVDYVQLLEGGDMQTTLEDAVRSAQLAAKRHKIAFILISQQKQDIEGRPRVNHMFGSSFLRMGAKLTIGLYRPYSHCPMAAMEKTGRYKNAGGLYPGIVEAWAVKNTMGEAMKAITLWVDGPTGSVCELTDDELRIGHRFGEVSCG